MQCSDLDRYLEAFLDGRLGRSRGALMRRHVAGCLACRTRIEKLRQFERELGRRFRSLERCEPIWTALEVDLVRSATHPAPLPEMPVMRALPPPREPGRLPPPPPATTERPQRRRRSRRLLGPLAGVLLIGAAMGTVYQLGMALLSPGADGALSLARPGFRGDAGTPDFPSGDAERLQRWLRETTGTDYPLPPQPDGFSLLGGSLDELGDSQAAVLLYGHGEATALLHIRPLGSAPPPPLPEPGVTQLRWEGPQFHYEVTSPLPAEALQVFAPLQPAGS